MRRKNTVCFRPSGLRYAKPVVVWTYPVEFVIFRQIIMACLFASVIDERAANDMPTGLWSNPTGLRVVPANASSPIWVTWKSKDGLAYGRPPQVREHRVSNAFLIMFRRGGYCRQSWAQRYGVGASVGRPTIRRFYCTIGDWQCRQICRLLKRF